MKIYAFKIKSFNRNGSRVESVYPVPIESESLSVAKAEIENRFYNRQTKDVSYQLEVVPWIGLGSSATFIYKAV